MIFPKPPQGKGNNGEALVEALSDAYELIDYLMSFGATLPDRHWYHGDVLDLACKVARTRERMEK